MQDFELKNISGDAEVKDQSSNATDSQPGHSASVEGNEPHMSSAALSPALPCIASPPLSNTSNVDGPVVAENKEIHTNGDLEEASRKPSRAEEQTMGDSVEKASKKRDTLDASTRTTHPILLACWFSTNEQLTWSRSAS